MKDNSYITATGISYAGTIPKIKKYKNQLRPIFEAFTNSLEAIKLLNYNNKKNQIIIKLVFNEKLFSKETNDYDFHEIIIEDTGIGFNDDEFKRLQYLNDTTKIFFNKGTGRIQFLHFFKNTEFYTIYQDTSSETGYKQRYFNLSKSNEYLKHNAIIYHKFTKDIKAEKSLTKLYFKNPLSEKDLAYFQNLTVMELKKNLISHYLLYFCENRDSLPQIEIKFIVKDEVKEIETIVSDDIPAVDDEKPINIYYCKISSDGRGIEKTENKETLKLKAFKIHKSKLNENGLKLTSKGEIAKDIRLDCLRKKDHIKDNRYLFLLSGKFINERDSDIRGEINIPTKEEYKEAYESSLFKEEEILLDDIREEANRNIGLMYEEIKNQDDKKKEEIEELKKMFLLNEESINSAKIKLNDSEGEILKKVYEADAKIFAIRDAEIKKQMEKLNELIPSDENYEETLKKQVDELVKVIPLQNRTALTQYVTRRKLVLELFDKILKKQLDILDSDSTINEKLLHNLIFQQSSDNPSESDLWLINEDFIYFIGTSETQLSKVKINGELIFKKEFSIEEEKYLSSFGENRKIKRPDVLLFPDEGKCIIIEFKAPDVNASEYLTQIDFYANLIRNYTHEKFQINTFYGYLIGENIEPRDVLGRVSRYEHSYHFDYLYRPSENVVGFDGRTNGSIYTEVIKYSTLLQRASKRNKIFIDKLKL